MSETGGLTARKRFKKFSFEFASRRGDMCRKNVLTAQSFVIVWLVGWETRVFGGAIIFKIAKKGQTLKNPNTLKTHLIVFH